MDDCSPQKKCGKPCTIEIIQVPPTKKGEKPGRMLYIDCPDCECQCAESGMEPADQAAEEATAAAPQVKRPRDLPASISRTAICSSG